MPLIIRDLLTDDLPRVAEFNNAAVPAVPFTTADELAALIALSDHSFGVVDDQTQQLHGFLIGFDPGSDYASENYRFFEQRGGDSFYVDRIVVDEDRRGQRLGRLLYDHAFWLARAAGRSEVTCEVNVEPPNPRSLAFHTRIGFAEIGRQATKGGSVQVALLAAPARSRVVEWADPTIGTRAAQSMSGLEYIRAMIDGTVPPPPMAALMRMAPVAAGAGTTTFECLPDESHYNPIGTVHGGLVCTLLDSAIGCAVQTTLPADQGYTSIEIKVSYLRPVRADTGRLTAVGTVTKPGRRVAFAEGTVVDAQGKLIATASSTCLVIPIA
ncbi:GNAT family N-acetyltransferase [Marisediminicola antarctica]|uniref:GNAT family N-acetyltransferase n=1 Tax=Marisediminicola antarctica TaxID=674079 RepID=UPI00137A14FE|nr:GNAT family N-acetyltransferase [Marisediminicola antarctica]